MGGVLMKHNIPACIERFKEILGENYSRLGLKGNGEGTGMMESFEKGSITADEFVQKILKYSKKGTTADEIILAWNLMHAGIPQERIDMLRELKEDGYRLYLLSNSNSIHWKDICDNYSIDGMFEDVFLSFVEHCLKPDEKFFRTVERRIDPSGEQILFIDDLAANRCAAEKLGWRVCSSIEELRKLKTAEIHFAVTDCWPTPL